MMEQNSKLKLYLKKNLLIYKCVQNNNSHSTKCNFKNLKTIIFQFYNSSIHSPSYTFSHLLYLISSSMNLFRIHSYPLFNSFVPSTLKKKKTKQNNPSSTMNQEKKNVTKATTSLRDKTIGFKCTQIPRERVAAIRTSWCPIREGKSV